MSADRRTVVKRWWPVGVVVLLGTVWWWSGRDPRIAEERSFRAEVLQVDTGALHSFIVRPAPSRGFPPMLFTRSGAGWTVTSNGASTPADPRPMQDLLAHLSRMRTERVLGDLGQVGARYSLSDSLANVLEIPDAVPPVRLRVGGSGGGDNREIQTSAVMLEGDPLAYTVPGELARLAAMVFPDWIPKPMVNGDPRNWRRLVFLFPGGNGYAMERHGALWTIGGMALDSSKVRKYLGNLSTYSSSGLVDPADTLNAVLAYQLVVEDTTRAQPVVLGVFSVGDHLIARSTLAPPYIVMPFSHDLELPRMFRPPQAFLPDAAGATSPTGPNR
ncbi:MAG TPA: DUF4340 domain-containing protein [Flavobacteriales bacterium]